MAYVHAPIMCDGSGVTLFSDRVELWLTHHGWTRYRLAVGMGGPGAEDQLRKWLRGDHEPAAKSVRRVAQALGITESQFWAGQTATAPTADELTDDILRRGAEAGPPPAPPMPEIASGERRRKQGRRASDQRPS